MNDLGQKKIVCLIIRLYIKVAASRIIRHDELSV